MEAMEPGLELGTVGLTQLRQSLPSLRRHPAIDVVKLKENTEHNQSQGILAKLLPLVACNYVAG